MAVITFEPIYQERVWGGRTIETYLERTLPKNTVIGESWDIVDRTDNQSVILNGRWKGMSLRQAIESDPKAIMGPQWPQKRAFPILVKWLDCQDRLSLQVHPPAGIAEKLKGEPKTEHWYIAQASQDAALLVGLKEKITREAFEIRLKNNNLEPILHRVPSKEGDAIFVPSGRLHAIDGGNLILEIQQNSDTTYRVYDWGRMGLDGKPRALHIEESLQCIDFNDIQPSLIHAKSQNNVQTLADCDAFRIRKLQLKKDETLALTNREGPFIISMLSGCLQDNDNLSLKKGVNGLIPSEELCVLTAQADTSILLTDHFA
ncbi:MAG TPA: mannose-6-phosphate isomerase [Opitutae bacterium]|nr:mannose-6-phosphate isomerase [Opitutae bacterium]|tara:strand:- start:6644 stop:7594 length:951 start_codon:yes stop_codon:yes gene_type:complete